MPLHRWYVAVGLGPCFAFHVAAEAAAVLNNEVCDLAFALLGASNLYRAYVRGLAYLAAHQGREAAAEFQKILDHRGIVVCDPIGALAHLQLGRAYALAGDQTKASHHQYHQYKLSSTQNSPSKPTPTCLWAQPNMPRQERFKMAGHQRKRIISTEKQIGMLKDASPIAHSDRPFVFRTSSLPREAFRREHSATFRNASSSVV